MSQAFLMSDNGLNRYLAKVRSYPILGQAEEGELARRWRDQRDEQALSQLAGSYLRLVVKMAMGNRGYGLPVSELISEGNLGLMQVLERMKIYQSGRYYFWQAPRLPIPGGEISRHSANMHMIPSSNKIARALKRVRRGQVVQLSGYLVKIEAPDGWQWRSSLSRKDTGNGSCEVIYVKDFRIRDS